MIITVPAIPPSPNILKRKYRNVHAYRRLRESWKHDLWYGIDGAHRRTQWLETIKSAGRVRIDVTFYHSHKFDPDNMVGALKPILDAMVQIGYVKNDDSEHLELGEIKQEGSLSPRTVIQMNFKPQEKETP